MTVEKDQILNIGGGVEYTYGVVGTNDNRGVITKFYQGDVEDAEDIVALAVSAAATFPGDTTLPLRTNTVRLMENGNALRVSRYGHRGITWIQALNAGPGFRSYRTWNYPGGWDADRIKTDPQGFYTPLILSIPVMQFTWGYNSWESTRPEIYSALRNTVNANTYSIDGYSFAPGTLRFDGVRLAHQRAGAYHHWRVLATATADETKFWKQGTLDWTTAPGTPGDDEPLYPSVTWPDIP